MNKNWGRYRNTTPEEYDKKGLSYFLWRLPSDKKIFSIIRRITNQKICDVGCGTGYYTKMLLKNNEVLGIDRNLHLAKDLGIKVIKADASSFSQKVKTKLNLVFSTWTTEYLGPEQLAGFFKSANTVLLPKGKLITTIIANQGWGQLYILMARNIRKVEKYAYSKAQVLQLLNQSGFNNIKIIDLNSWLAIPWAYLVMAEKN